MKLAIAQMVLGVLIVFDVAALGGFIDVWPNRRFYLFFSYFGLGVAVTGCGIAQYLTERR